MAVKHFLTLHDLPTADLEAIVQRAIALKSEPAAAASLAHKVRIGAVRGIFTSMVDLSDNAGLMDRFLGLPCPKMFMYGDQNGDLSYLSHIEANGVELAEIPECGHFPMYANPPAMWRRLGDFIARAEAAL